MIAVATDTEIAITRSDSATVGAIHPGMGPRFVVRDDAES
jgi:hypothetical protein